MDIQTVKDVTNTALGMRGGSHNGSYTLVDQRPWEHQSKLSTLFDKYQSPSKSFLKKAVSALRHRKSSCDHDHI